jgi:hypothetical protein
MAKIETQSESESDRFNLLISLRGIAKDLFEQLGGGEHFISTERKSFIDQEK